MLERDKGKSWRIVKPIGADADQTQANNLARAIADGVLVRTVDDKPDRPRAVRPQAAHYDNHGDDLRQENASIDRGRQSRLRSAFTLTFNSPTAAVLLTEGAFSAGMNKTVNDLRVRDLMAFKIDDVQKLIITHDNGSHSRNRSRRRQLENRQACTVVRLIDTAVRQALSTLVNARATDFISTRPPTPRNTASRNRI